MVKYCYVDLFVASLFFNKYKEEESEVFKELPHFTKPPLKVLAIYLVNKDDTNKFISKVYSQATYR